MAASPAAGYQATFTPRISVSEEYTDNYFLTDDNKVYEYITTISPAFTAQILWISSGAEISYAPSYAIYDRFNENDTLRHNAQFFGWTEIAKKRGLWGLASKAKVNQVGNSIAVTIASKIAKFTNLKKGEEVRVYPENRHRLIVEISS